MSFQASFRHLAQAALFGLLVLVTGGALAQANVKNRQYIAKASGCMGCHTDTNAGALLVFAGGRASWRRLLARFTALISPPIAKLALAPGAKKISSALCVTAKGAMDHIIFRRFPIRLSRE